MLVRSTIVGLVVALVLGGSSSYLVRADETVTLTQDVRIVIAEAGTFSASLRTADGSAPTFGTISLDAVDDQTVSQTFVLDYTDTYTERGAGDITLSISSFEPDSPVPPFTGSDQVDFQIPNRYLTLTEVGSVESAASPPGCAGAITAVTGDEGQTFDVGQRRTVATVAQGCGVGTASQAIQVALTVPAGVYPATYSATVTIETTVEATAP